MGNVSGCPAADCRAARLLLCLAKGRYEHRHPSSLHPRVSSLCRLYAGLCRAGLLAAMLFHYLHTTRLFGGFLPRDADIS